MSELEKFDFSDIFPSEKSEFVRFDDVKEQLKSTKEALKNLVDANDNLHLSIDGRGDLWRALDNAREVLNAY